LEPSLQKPAREGWGLDAAGRIEVLFISEPASPKGKFGELGSKCPIHGRFWDRRRLENSFHVG